VSDVFSKQKRSEVMSKIRGKGNKDTELALIRVFKEFHITGWRRNQPVFGKPDFVFPKAKIAIFVDGCFWHGCPQHSTMPKNNQGFWQKKLSSNKSRDEVVNEELIRKGWKVIRIWEHEFKEKNKVAEKIRACINNMEQS
jgi:DNA mismatch endonuclease (patch repair protein)